MNSDVTKGVLNRFKAMDASRGAVLTGHVVASVLTSLVAIEALIGGAFPLGFRPSAGLLDRLGVVGVIALVALGPAATSSETAGLATVPLVMLPFFSGAIVPAETMWAPVSRGSWSARTRPWPSGSRDVLGRRLGFSPRSGPWSARP